MDKKEKKDNEKDDIYSVKNGFIPIDEYFAEMKEMETQEKKQNQKDGSGDSGG